MTGKQLAALFMIALGLNTMGSVASSLLPIYLGKFGADTAVIGFYMASITASIAVGVVMTGWLSDRLQHRKMGLIVAGVVEVISLWLIGQAATMTHIYLTTVLVGLLFGVQASMINILAGLFAEEEERGRVFGLLASAGALGALIGGLTGGPIVDRWGFSGFWTAAAMITLVQPLAALFVEDKVVEPVKRGAASTSARSPLLSATFLLLLFASIFVFISNSVQGLGRTLLMDQSGFGAAGVSSTVAVAGLLSLPFPFLLGGLSDRVGRKPLIMGCYLASAISLVILAGSSALWQFWISTALQVIVGASIAVGSALVTDLVPPESLGSALSLFNISAQIGQIVGLLAMGIAIKQVGMTTTLVGGALLALIGIGLIIPIRLLVPDVVVVVVPPSAEPLV